MYIHVYMRKVLYKHRASNKTMTYSPHLPTNFVAILSSVASNYESNAKKIIYENIAFA